MRQLASQEARSTIQALEAKVELILYITPEGHLSTIVSDFSGNASLIQLIKWLSGVDDLLVGVPCMCEAVNDTLAALFHDTEYKVKMMFLNSTIWSVVICSAGGRYPQQYWWILFVPMDIVYSSKKKDCSLSIIVAASMSAAVLLFCLFAIIIRLKKKSSHNNVEAPEIKIDRVPSNTSVVALESRFFPSVRINDIYSKPSDL